MRLSLYSTSFFMTGALALALASGAIGCGDDKASDDGDDGASGTPVYAVASSVTTPQPTTYVILSESLSGELRTENAALEIPGTAVAGGPVGGKRLYVGTATSGEVKRYDLSGDGKSLTQSGVVNFEARQVPNLSGYGSGFQFVDEHKAYWLSWTAGKIVVWDPTDMVVTGEIAVPQVVRQNPESPGTPYQTSVTGAPLRDGNTLYYFTAWDSRNANVIKVVPSSTVVAIDTQSDTAQVYVDEGGCGYARDGVVVGEWIYLVTEAVGAAVNYMNPSNGPTPCMRRFNRSTKQFDTSYKIDLNALASGSPVGSLITSSSGQPFVYVLDRTSADPPIAAKTVSNPRLLSVGSYWRTARLTVGDAPRIDLLGNALSSSSVLPHTLRNGLKVTATFDPQTQQLREVGTNGVVPTSNVNAKLFGNTGSIVQLR